MFCRKTEYENLDWTGLKQDSVLVISSDNNKTFTEKPKYTDSLVSRLLTAG
jgi:hypothetical protein